MNIKRTRHIFQANPEVVNQDIITVGTEAAVNNQGTIQNITQNVNGEKFLDTYAVTPLPNYEGEEKDVVNNKLSFLDRKLTATRKTITALDSYHIIGDAKTSTDVYAFINSLLPNTSFIVNTPNTVSYAFNNIDYQLKKGDLIYKGLDNNLIYVPALASGYYYPSAFTNPSGNTYELTYSFTSNPPKEGTEQAIGNGEYKNLQASFAIKEEQFTYNQQFALTAKQQKEINVGRALAKPIVYYYYEGERVMFDEDFISNATKDPQDPTLWVTKITIANPSSLTIDVEVR